MDLAAVSDPSVDSRLTAGEALVAVGRLGATITTPDSSAVALVAGHLGNEAASDAAAVAAAFEGLNRVVDGVGLPVSRAGKRDEADLIEALGLGSFPHASH